MPSISISQLFEKLGAPLSSVRRSWGAVRKTDGTVFLRVWQDKKIFVGQTAAMMVTNKDKYEDDPDNSGYKERLEHVALVRGGAACYMIMCKVKDPLAIPRTIESFNAKELFPAGQIVEKDGSFYLTYLKRVPVSEVVPKS